MGATSTKFFRRCSSSYNSASGSGNDSVFQDSEFERTFKGGSPYVLIRQGSMFFDEDGDLAHEFYVEVLPQSKRGKPTMRRVTECLRPQGMKMSMVRLISRVKLKTVVICTLALFILDYFGAFTHLFELPFDENFHYPYNGDISQMIEQLRNNEKPDIPPLNVYNYTFLFNCKTKCFEEEQPPLRVVYLVKSAVKNFEQRKAIRKTWGFERRFSDVPIRTVFLLGLLPAEPATQLKIDEEQQKYGDIVQASFVDNYYNNTIKTMMGFKWIMQYCQNSKFYIFSDDDMYISTRNVLRFLRNPTNYPDYLIAPVELLKYGEPAMHRNLKSMEYELPDEVKLFAGFVFVSAPHRHQSSKWYVPLSEYRYHLWPPYVTAGAYALSREALIDMYYGSMYTKHFRFDDIYLGLVAKKVGIEPYHCEEFHFYKKPYNVYSYRYVVASHGFSPEELMHVWNEQKSAGNA